MRARRRRWRSIGDHNLSWFGGMVDSNDDIGYIFRVSLPRIFHLTTFVPTSREVPKTTNELEGTNARLLY